MNILCTIVNKHANFANLRLQIEKILTNNKCFEHSKTKSRCDEFFDDKSNKKNTAVP